jgi:hypothetical protein
MSSLLIAVALLLANPAKPPSAEEQRLYEEGTRALAGGDAAAAERAFKAGYELGRDPAFLVHLGEAQEKAGAAARAADTYRRYLREAPDASDRAEIEARLTRVAPGGAAAPAAPAPTEAPGEFGGSPTPAAPPPLPLAPAAAADPEGPPKRDPGSDSGSDSGWNRYNTTAVIASGAALLLLGTTAFFAARAGSTKDDVNRLTIYQDETTGAPLRYSSIADRYEQLLDDGRRYDRYAKIALVAAGGAAAVAAVFYVLDARFGQEPTLAIAPDGRGVAVLGGWRWRY